MAGGNHDSNNLSIFESRSQGSKKTDPKDNGVKNSTISESIVSDAQFLIISTG